VGQGRLAIVLIGEMHRQIVEVELHGLDQIGANPAAMYYLSA